MTAFINVPSLFPCSTVRAATTNPLHRTQAMFATPLSSSSSSPGTETISALLDSGSSAVASSDGSTTTTAGTAFEPVPPESYVLVGFVAVSVLSAAAVYVWANQVVPVSRTRLAMSKKSGAVRQYLDELQASGSTSTTASNVTAAATGLDEIDSSSFVAAAAAADSTDASSANGRGFERWLFADWLEGRERTAGRQKEPALPILKDEKWNSGDNPVLAAAALIGIAVLVSSAIEHVFS